METDAAISTNNFNVHLDGFEDGVVLLDEHIDSNYYQNQYENLCFTAEWCKAEIPSIQWRLPATYYKDNTGKDIMLSDWFVNDNNNISVKRDNFFTVMGYDVKFRDNSVHNILLCSCFGSNDSKLGNNIETLFNMMMKNSYDNLQTLQINFNLVLNGASNENNLHMNTLTNCIHCQAIRNRRNSNIQAITFDENLLLIPDLVDKKLATIPDRFTELNSTELKDFEEDLRFCISVNRLPDNFSATFPLDLKDTFFLEFPRIYCLVNNKDMVHKFSMTQMKCQCQKYLYYCWRSYMVMLKSYLRI